MELLIGHTLQWNRPSLCRNPLCLSLQVHVMAHPPSRSDWSHTLSIQTHGYPVSTGTSSPFSSSCRFIPRIRTLWGTQMRDHLRGPTALGHGTASSWLAKPKWLWLRFAWTRLPPVQPFCGITSGEEGAGPGRDRLWNFLLGPVKSLLCFVLLPGNSCTLFGILWVCFHIHIVNPA